MTTTDGKCGVVSDFCAWDGTKFRCLHDLEHPGLSHSWEKYRSQFTIFGGITTKEIEMGIAMRCPCGEEHDWRSKEWEFVRNVVEAKGATVKVTVAGEAWDVPRVYIAMHGLKAQALPVLAEKYGWRKAA